MFGTCNNMNPYNLCESLKDKKQIGPKLENPDLCAVESESVYCTGLTKEVDTNTEKSKMDSKHFEKKNINSKNRFISMLHSKKSETSKDNLPKDGSAHPSPKNHSRYYHTYTAASTRRQSTVTRVMDIFRKQANDSCDNKIPQKGVCAKLWKVTDIFHSSSRRNSKTDLEDYSKMFRISRGLSCGDEFLQRYREHRSPNDSSIYLDFFKFHKCTELIPTSAKVVILDSELLVRKAFFALVNNSLHAAPIWSSKKQNYIGMLTITDFIKLLLKFQDVPSILIDLEDHTLEMWRKFFKDSCIPIISIGPDMTLYDAVLTLTDNHIHRLPVIDPETGDLLYTLTLKCIMKFLFLYISKMPLPVYMNYKLSDMNIGTKSSSNLITVTDETPLIDALQMFISNHVSALPILDNYGKLKNLYSKCDVINLAIDKTYLNLNATIKEVCNRGNIWYEGVQTCTLDNTLYDILEKIVHTQVHRLVLVDKSDFILGVISLSDIMKYIISESSKDL